MGRHCLECNCDADFDEEVCDECGGRLSEHRTEDLLDRLAALRKTVKYYKDGREAWRNKATKVSSQKNLLKDRYAAVVVELLNVCGKMEQVADMLAGFGHHDYNREVPLAARQLKDRSLAAQDRLVEIKGEAVDATSTSERAKACKDDDYGSPCD